MIGGADIIHVRGQYFLSEYGPGGHYSRGDIIHGGTLFTPTTSLSFSSVDSCRALECGNSDTATVGNCFVVLRNSKGQNYVSVSSLCWWFSVTDQHYSRTISTLSY